MASECTKCKRSIGGFRDSTSWSTYKGKKYCENCLPEKCHICLKEKSKIFHFGDKIICHDCYKIEQKERKSQREKELKRNSLIRKKTKNYYGCEIECDNCGHVWVIRKKRGQSTRCGKCNSLRMTITNEPELNFLTIQKFNFKIERYINLTNNKTQTINILCPICDKEFLQKIKTNKGKKEIKVESECPNCGISINATLKPINNINYEN